METWIFERLSNILDFPVPDDLVKYISSIENPRDLEEYMRTLLNFNDSKHHTFFQELIQKKNSKGQITDIEVGRTTKKKNAKNKTTQQILNVTQEDTLQYEEKRENASTKKKKKFVNLYSTDGQNAQVVLLKGRNHCDCQASKHSLVNNCLTCGRIVCKQEGSGPCLFCGNLVCTPEEQKELNARTKASGKLMDVLTEKNRPKGWEAAILQRNRLLEYDQTSERRTKVLDDDSDYFNSGSVWLSKAEREKLDKYQKSLVEKKHSSRLQKKMIFDFAGRQVVEDDTIDYEVDENIIKDITNSSNILNENFVNSTDIEDRKLAPGLSGPLLEFDPTVKSNAHSKKRESGGAKVAGGGGLRVQDAGVQEMVDAGKCLSMHQPWASLLVNGIKIHEGRSWYTSHRGRLWIASTVQQPDQTTIKMLENSYKALHKDDSLKFPETYPTGCLLGCVNVDDCLPQEEYRKIYPEGESDSPFVLVCSNTISLPLRFPMRGQHKIYNLDKNIHQASVKCLQHRAKLQVEQ